jgi:uncharacterized protein YjbJ (UPF0337 family)
LIEVELISWQCQNSLIRKEELGAMPKEDATMNWHRIAGNLKLVKEQINQQCGKLADDDPDIVEGKKGQVTGKLPERMVGVVIRRQGSWTHTSKLSDDLKQK